MLITKDMFKRKIASVLEVVENPIKELTVEEHLAERKKKLQEKKMHIAALASAIVSDPESNVSSTDPLGASN